MSDLGDGLEGLYKQPLDWTPQEKPPQYISGGDGRLYEMTITATGEVRDADGNLISSEPVEAKAIVTHEQMLKIQGEQK